MRIVLCLALLGSCFSLAAVSARADDAEAPEGYGLVKGKVITAAPTPTEAFQKLHATGTDMYLVQFKVKRVLSQPKAEALPLKKGDTFDAYVTAGENSTLNTGRGAEFIDESRHRLQHGEIYIVPVKYQVSDAIFIVSSLPGSMQLIPHRHLPQFDGQLPQVSELVKAAEAANQSPQH